MSRFLLLFTYLSILSSYIHLVSCDLFDNIQNLINRVLKRAKVEVKFSPLLEIIEFSEGNIDVFEIDKGNQNEIIFRGSSGVALSAAFGHYLRNYLYCDFHWKDGGGYSFQNFPKDLKSFPVPSKPERVEFLSKYRYYQNTCTFSYSSAWKAWDAWEQEIDWMAMSGINLPLAFTGQEIVWDELWRTYGISQSGIDAYFTGPAFLAWNRMSNIQGFGGPLPSSWIENQASLQRLILARFRDLELTPVLPAFNGVVPEEFTALFPSANITQLPAWNNFPSEYTCNYMLSPTDPLFKEVGTAFLKIQEDIYGKQTFIYNCDTFNENSPSSDDVEYLKSASLSVFESMVSVDPGAVWLMQGWLFIYDPFWTDAAIQAYLSGVPDDRMIVLDLSSDEEPIWEKLAANNKSFIWCLLHNFGGSRALYGNLTTVTAEPYSARVAQPGFFIGTGLTMESIDQNPVIYELMTEIAKYNQSPVDIHTYIRSYVLRRYGISSKGEAFKYCASAWQILQEVYYSGTLNCENSGGPHCLRRSIVTIKPGLSMVQDTVVPAAPLVTVWSLLHNASSSSSSSSSSSLLDEEEESVDVDVNGTAWRYDVVDVGRQVMMNLFYDLYLLWVAAYERSSLSSVQTISENMLEIIGDLDTLLATHESYLLGVWLEEAKSWGTTSNEMDLYEYNARNQITLWGPNGEIDDYAAKNWAGLIGSYYYQRWELLFNYVSKSLSNNTPFNQTEYDNEELQLGKNFCQDKTIFPTSATGSTVTESAHMQTKYGQLYNSNYEIYEDSDIEGGDLTPNQAAWTKDTHQLMYLCDADPECMGFNSLGFLKLSTTSSNQVEQIGINLYLKKK